MSLDRVLHAGLRNGISGHRHAQNSLLSVTARIVAGKHSVVFPWHKCPDSNSVILGNSLKKYCLYRMQSTGPQPVLVHYQQHRGNIVIIKNGVNVPV